MLIITIPCYVTNYFPGKGFFGKDWESSGCCKVANLFPLCLFQFPIQVYMKQYKAYDGHKEEQVYIYLICILIRAYFKF